MYLVLYFIYRFFSCLRNHQQFTKQENPYLCFKYYFDDKTSAKKSFFRVFKEVNRLFGYWHQFPDTYFIFCHYLKEYNDFNLIKSFLPQGAYYNFCKGGLESSSYRIIVNDKILFHDFMEYYELPTSKVLFAFRNNHFFINKKLVDEEAIDILLLGLKDDIVFMKLPSAGAANGVFVIKKKYDDYFFNDEKVNAEWIKNKYKGNSVFFEERIEQDPIFKSYNPDTINTVRILTKNYSGKIEIVSAAARFGRKGQFVDNIHAGGIGVSINLESGCMERYGARRFDSKKYLYHPDSGFEFNGVQVPQWEQIKKLVLKTVAFLPQFRSLGFDIVTTTYGPIVLEINTGAGMDLAQIGKEMGIADKFDKHLTRRFK